MILIYTHTSTKRLQYICKFIFKETFNIPYSLTVDTDGFIDHSGPKINYSNTVFEKAGFCITPHTLLFETNIIEQQISVFQSEVGKAFFKIEKCDMSFDIFAAAFYLLSRYEEYLPHQKDSYGRYSHENSIAFKENFLDIPLINVWLIYFQKKLRLFYPSLIFQNPSSFSFIPTYDIDIAWSYKNKGLARNLGGFIKKPSLERLKVLAGFKKDPFNCYEFLNDLHLEHKLEPIYFFLVASSRNKYDKNISPNSNAMKQVIRLHAKLYDIGLHPSWKSNERTELLKREKNTLSTLGNISVKKTRQHYVKFELPETMERILEAGIENEYSMGYGSINGFRASVASPFYWFNLKKETATRLLMHPFCFMDANCHYEQTLTIEQSHKELMHYYNECKKVNGKLITIFHNNFLGTDGEFAGWRELYVDFISQVQQ